MVATTADATAAAPAAARLPYWPALDGLRGAAMAAILFFHSQIGWAKGGFLCVSIFFTLSGFLITSLVTVERERTGRISLSAFWARRARRLVPASIVALLLAAVVTAVAVPAGQQADVAWDIRSALLQVANWRFIAEGAVYADLNVVPSPVQHYWSLAIEEQFYILFPIVALLALRRRKLGLGVVFVGVVAVSLLRQLSLDGADRVYFGTDTRAAEIAVGGLLALAYPRLRALPALRRWPVAEVAGFVGLAASTVIFLGVGHDNEVLYSGGLAAFSIISACMVFASVEGTAFRRLLSWKPVVELGKMSYGVYLYHFPFYVWLTEERVGFGGYGLLAVRLLPTMAMAFASYHLLERPIRTGAALHGPRARLAWGGAMAAVLLVAVPVGRLGEGDVELAFQPVAPPSSTSTTTAPDGTGEPIVPIGSEVTSPTGPTSSTSTIAPARPPRIVVVGDSTARANGEGLLAWGQETGRLQVVVVHEPGCGPLFGVRFQIREGYTFEPQRCDQLFPRAASAARELDADAIVVFIGSSQLADWEYRDLEGLHHLGEPIIDQRYAVAVRLAIAQLEMAGRPILWATVPLPEWDLDAFSRMIGGTPIPGDPGSPISLNDPPRTRRLNELNNAAVPASRLAVLWPYAERLAGSDGDIPTRLRPDGLHLSTEGAKEVADAWMFEVLGEAFRTVVARHPAGMVDVDRHSWSAPGAPLG